MHAHCTFFPAPVLAERYATERSRSGRSLSAATHSRLRLGVPLVPAHMLSSTIGSDDVLFHVELDRLEFALWQVERLPLRVMHGDLPGLLIGRCVRRTEVLNRLPHPACARRDGSRPQGSDV